jgi:exosome complex component RRP4
MEEQLQETTEEKVEEVSSEKVAEDVSSEDNDKVSEEKEVSEDKEVASEVRVEKERRVVTPGEVVGGEDNLPGEGTKRVGGEIIAQRYGLFDEGDKLVKVIPLSGVFTARRGNVIIGKVDDITFNGWLCDINSAHNSFLPVSEIPRYIDKHHLDEFMEIGDFFSAKITSVKAKGIDLSLDSRGLGKLEGGMIISVNPNKVPRVIGRSGSMIKLIKDSTNTRITVGQNGFIWIRGESVDDELRAKKAINFVTARSFVSGLTEKVEEFLKEASA